MIFAGRAVFGIYRLVDEFCGGEWILTISVLKTKQHRALTQNRYSGVDLSMAVTPECGSDDVIVAPRYVGLCGTDVQVYRGGHEAAANVLGHAGVGVVVEVGESVTSWSRGETVVFNPVNPSNPDDVLGLAHDGLFQERVLIENVDLFPWRITRIPAHLVDPLGVLIVPVATAIYSALLADLAMDSRHAVIIGDGPMALIMSVVLRLFGYQSVQLVHGSSTRSRWAVNNGYFHQSDLVAFGSDVSSKLVSRLGGIQPSLAVICTPGEMVEQAASQSLSFLKPGGLINFVSFASPSVISLSGGDLDVRALQNRNLSGIPNIGSFQGFVTGSGKPVQVTGQRGVSVADIVASIDLISENSLHFRKLITDVVEIRDAVSFISSAVEWSLGRGVGERPMKAVVELNSQII